MTDLDEVAVEDGYGVPGVCPECRGQRLLAVLNAASDVRIRHGKQMRVCKSRDVHGPTYYVHLADEDVEADE